MIEPLVDLLYEAAGQPELWTQALDAIAEATGAMGCALLVVPVLGRPRWIASNGSGACLANALASEFGRSVTTGRAGRSTRPIELGHPGPIRGGPAGGKGSTHAPGWHIAASIALTDKTTAALALKYPGTEEHPGRARPARSRTHPLLPGLRPHLARACQLGARVARGHAACTVRALDAMGLAAAVLAASGRVLTMNDRLRGMTDDVVLRRGDGVAFTDPAINRRVRDFLANGDARRETCSIPLRTGTEHGAFVLHLLPLPRDAGDVFSSTATLLVVAPVRAAGRPDHDVLRGLFGLTPAEVRLLQALADGARLAAYADRAGVRRSTVRTQLASIFGKTGTARQADLLRLIASVAMFPNSALAPGMRPRRQEPDFPPAAAAGSRNEASMTVSAKTAQTRPAVRGAQAAARGKTLAMDRPCRKATRHSAKAG